MLGKVLVNYSRNHLKTPVKCRLHKISFPILICQRACFFPPKFYILSVLQVVYSLGLFILSVPLISHSRKKTGRETNKGKKSPVTGWKSIFSKPRSGSMKKSRKPSIHGMFLELLTFVVAFALEILFGGS